MSHCDHDFGGPLLGMIYLHQEQCITLHGHLLLHSVSRPFNYRQCALTLGQLCDSRMLLTTLQNHCQDALWYRVPKDAPSYVDLGAYMFQQTDEFRLAGSGEHRKVATIVSFFDIFLYVTVYILINIH